MEYRILERLEVTRDGQRMALGGSKQRALLAVLLLHRRSVVSLDRLVEHLWGECPPRTAEKTIQVYVSRLRKLLGSSVLQTVGRGYRLAVESGQVDVDRFDTLVAGGRAALRSGDATRAVDLLSAALSLCPEQPLDEFDCEPFARVEISRLQEARLAALEDLIDAQLRAGRGPELVLQLQRLVVEHPLRERLIAGLMLALYQGGRQSDALATYRAARGRLVDGLGLEPGPELTNLERRILEHDETLTASRPQSRAARRPMQRRRRVALLGAPLAVLVMAAFILGFAADRQSVTRLGGAGGLVAVNAGSGRVMIASPLAESVAAVDDGQGSVWVADSAGSIARIDPRSGAVENRIVVGGEPAGVVSGDGAIWTVGTVGATVTRIDPGTETVTQRIHLPASSLGAMAFGSGELWLADSIDHRLFEIDPRNGTLRRSLSLQLQPSAVTVAGGKLWVTGYDSSTIEKIDPASAKTIGRADVGDGPVAVSFGAGSIWVANSLDATVSRIDPVTLQRQATIPVGSGPSAIAVVGGSVWVANQYSGSVFRIDPRRNVVAAKVSVGGSPMSLTAGSGRIWVGVGATPGSHRGGTLRIVTPTQRFASIDPAFYDDATDPQFIGLAYDTLVTFDHSGTDAGLRLVPDLALSLPKPTDDGATYTFRLRPGIRYSDGRPLRALDFRRAIERLFRLRSPGASLFGQVSGSSECQRRPVECDLSRGIVTDDAARTVTYNLTAPDPDFLFKLSQDGFSAPIPAGTPDRAPQSTPPVGTGPYRIQAVTKAQIRFARNPYFREWSHAAQPDGNPDAIDWRFFSSARDAVSAVTRVQADWFFGLIPLAQYHELKLHDPGLLHSSAQFAVDFIPLNTRRAPFDDSRVRRALNYAIDRGRIAGMYGGSDFAAPTCQPLTPGLPGYSRYCPYTLHPAADGAWRAPDLAKARRLVGASGTRGERVDVWAPSDPNYVPRSVAVYIAGVLRTLGYRVRLRLVPYESITEAQRKRFQLSVDGDWVAEYPEPSSYLPLFFSCGGGNSNQYYCNPRLDRGMQRATKLDLRNPLQAGRGWTAVDHQLTDDAPWVPTVNLRQVDLVSSRLRNYQYNPVWGFLVDQSWLG